MATVDPSLAPLHLSAGWRRRLACPRCHSPLSEASASLSCSSCSASFPKREGIVNFGVADTFYDEHGFTSAGRDFSNTLVGRIGLYFARQHHLYDIARTIPAGSSVIEIGCGGGSRFLASRYDMLGVEISSLSVRHAATTYPSAMQATVEELPLADNCCDGISSSYVLEHLGDDIVARSLSEMARVLRPGGIMIHCFDLAASGPFHRWARRTSWYNPVCVASKGHFGLRPLADWLPLFREAGFQMLPGRLYARSWLQDLSVWGALNVPEVRGFPRLLGRAAAALRKATDWKGDVLTTLLTDCIDPCLPQDWAGKAILRLRKNG